MPSKGQGSPTTDELRMMKMKMMMHDSNYTDSTRVVSSASVCSDGASAFHAKRKYQQSEEESSYLSDNYEEDYDDLIRGNAGAKRSRIDQLHYLSERRRRYKIDKKMCALRSLIPNCNTADKASVLDEAIEYLRALQLQAKIMSMRCMSQMMLQTRMQQLHVPYLPHFSPLSIEMGMRMAMSANYNQAHFPTSQSMIPATTFPMVGVPRDSPLMSLSTAHFIPFLGGSSAQSVLMGNVYAATSTVEHPS